MSHEDQFPTTGIHQYVSAYISGLPDLSGKVVVDIPCGDGRASHFFRDRGATVKAFDLYPEFMKAPGIDVQQADMAKHIPMADESADYIVCQEGIEHIPDQIGLFKEFNRILRKNGELLMTTPNLSHARARLSWLLLETDLWKRFPATEIDSIWFADAATERMYFGHLFLVGVHRLQTLMSVSGFHVTRRIKTDMSFSSLFLGILLYPFLLLGSGLSYLLYRGKNTHVERNVRFRILKDHLRLNLSYKTLFCKHIFWVSRKDASIRETIAELQARSMGIRD